MKNQSCLNATCVKAFAVLLTAAGMLAPVEASVVLRNIAHRGLWQEARLPQNTVEAIRAAYEAGAKIVETDFAETKAGEIICLHDRKALESMSSFAKNPADITPADRAAINLGEKAGLPRPYRIPLLKDVLAAVPKDGVLQSEIKVYGPNYARWFDEAVKAAGLTESNILVSSFNLKALADFHRKYPAYETIWLGCGVKKDGMSVDAVIAEAKASGIAAVCPGCAGARAAGWTRADADRIRAAGLDFRVYGVNDRKALAYAADLRAASFTCNTFKKAYTWARELKGVELWPAEKIEKTTFAYGAGGILRAPGMCGRLIGHAEGWAGTVSASAKEWKLPDAETGRIRFSASDAKGLAFDGLVEAKETEAGVAVCAEAVSTADAKPECVAYTFELELPTFVGWTWTVDRDKGPLKGTVPAQYGRMSLFTGTATAISLTAPDGRKGYRWTFPEARPITFQDNRQWGQTLSVRIGSRPREFTKGTKVRMSFVVSALGGQTLGSLKPYVVSANEEWVPVDLRKNIVPGSALDFSNQGILDAPAGKYGWLRNANGDFEFEGLPGKKQRFYGINLCFSANTPTHELADELVDRLARLGYNSIRIHHYEKPICRDRAKEGRGLDPAKTDKLDYLIAKGIERGFYFTTDVFVSRTVFWEDVGLEERGKGKPVAMQLYKVLVAVWDPAFEDWKRFAKEFLEHVNPYTGRAYKDEPALPLLSLVNEGQLTMGWKEAKEDPLVEAAYQKWLAEKRAANPAYRPEAPDTAAKLNFYGKDGEVMGEFMADVERRSARRMKAYLRSIGAKALVTNANCGPHPAAMASVRGDVYDYTDDHFYVDHPHFLCQSWRLPSQCENANPIRNNVRHLMKRAYTRFAGQPMCITEWNFSGPGMYRGVGGVLTGAFAALQDWSGVWRFAYSHSEENLRGDVPAKPGYFDVATDLLGLMSDKASLCLFLRGDLGRTEDAYALEADAATFATPRTEQISCDPKDWSDLAWYARMAVTTPDKAVPPGVRRLKMSETFGRSDCPVEKKPNPAFRLDRDGGSFVIDTPRTSGGFAEEGTLDCGRLTFALDEAPATVWASSVDPTATDLTQAKRLVVFHLTDVQANGNVYQDDSKKVLLKWGKAPSVMRTGSAVVTVRLADPAAYEVWSIASDGSRRERMTADVVAGALRFVASVRGPDGARFAYEVVKKGN